MGVNPSSNSDPLPPGTRGRQLSQFLAELAASVDEQNRQRVSATRNAAATRLQAQVRGQEGRRISKDVAAIKVAKELEAARLAVALAAAIAKEKADVAAAKALKENMAATTIQSNVRGTFTRRQTKVLLDESRVAKAAAIKAAEEAAIAAAKAARLEAEVQAEMAEVKVLENNAAILIQANFRGVKGRRVSQAMLSSKRIEMEEARLAAEAAAKAEEAAVIAQAAAEQAAREAVAEEARLVMVAEEARLLQVAEEARLVKVAEKEAEEAARAAAIVAAAAAAVAKIDKLNAHVDNIASSPLVAAAAPAVLQLPSVCCPVLLLFRPAPHLPVSRQPAVVIPAVIDLAVTTIDLDSGPHVL